MPGRAGRYARGERGRRSWCWSPALAGRGGAVLHPRRQPKGGGLSRRRARGSKGCLLGPMEERGLGGGEGWGGDTLACALSPAAAGAELLAGASRSGSARGCRSARGSPDTCKTPVHPAASFPSKGQDAQALLSAGLSPRAVASSLKEGRSLGLGAQQRCISLARREGQPSGCGSFVFPDCRPAVKAKSKVDVEKRCDPLCGVQRGQHLSKWAGIASPEPCLEQGEHHTAQLAPSTRRKGNRLQCQGQHKVLHIPARTSSSASGV